MANYNVDIALKVSGNSALDQLNKKLKEVEERQEQINKSTLLANNYLRPRAAAERDFAKFKEKTLEDNRKIAEQEQKILNIAKERASVEQSFLERNREDYKLARQKTAEFLRQQRLLLKMSRQYSEPIGPVASGAVEFRRDKARRQRAQFIASGAPGVPVAGAQQALPAFRERGLQILDNSVRLNESQLRIEAALNGERQRGVRFLEAQSREEQRQLDLGITGQRSNLISGVSSGKAVPRTQYSRPIGPQPAKAGGGAARGRSGGLSNLALGVGFPLLFGGGVGSVAGGALGSAGGMGGQVLGSAIGGIIDQTVSNIAKLGQALNPFTSDIKAVTAAAGESGTAFERLVVQLEEVAGKEKALEVATAQLATVIGREGVDALKEFGDASSDLSNELSKALTALGAALAPFLADITRATANAVERSRLLRRGSNDLANDPGVQQIRRDLSERKIGELEAEDRIAKLIREKELEEQIGIAKQAQADIQAKINEKTSSSIVLKEQELVITQNGGDILNEQVQTALQNIDAEKVRLKILEAQGDELKLNLAYAEGQLLFAIRTAKIEAAAEARRAKEQREANAAAREAAREQEAREREAKRLQESIFNEDLKQLQIQSKINQFSQGELEAIETQRQELGLVLNARISQIKLTTEDLSLQKERIDTLKLEASLELARLDRTEEQIRQTEQLNSLSAAAGFDVLSVANNIAPFQRGMGTEGSPVSFEAGMELAPLIAYQLELDKILEKYPLIGEAAAAAAGVVTLGVNEMINGTKSAEEVFSEFLKSIADMLLKTAQQMIAQYIAIGIAKAFAGLLGGGSSPSISDFGGSFGAFSPGASFNVPALPFAEGGYVTGPTNALIGEGGEPEYVIPESKMRESMSRYSRGSRGSSVIPAEGGGAAGAEGGVAVSAPIDVRYTVERINSVDYVTADQFQAGMRQATQQGAAQGENRALAKLRNSPGARRRIGL